MKKHLSTKISNFCVKTQKTPKGKDLPGVFVYDEEAVPPGISNSALNCYASCIFQCLFNHGSFISLVKDIIDEHDTAKCDHCRTQGNFI